MEYWDLYDEHYHKTGERLRRGEPVPPGRYFVGVAVWIVNDRDEVLVTLRHPDKVEYPNTWENTGGALIAGEEVRAAVKREAKEEIGLDIDEDELIHLGSRRKEKMFFESFLLRRNAELSEITLQEGETVDVKWVTLDELDRMIADGSLALPIGQEFLSVREKFYRLIGKTL